MPSFTLYEANLQLDVLFYEENSRGANGQAFALHSLEQQALSHLSSSIAFTITL